MLAENMILMDYALHAIKVMIFKMVFASSILKIMGKILIGDAAYGTGMVEDAWDALLDGLWMRRQENVNQLMIFAMIMTETQEDV